MLAPSLDSAAHIVQLALTPIFLLAGIASLLNVFTVRLGRIGDRAHRLKHESGGDRAELQRLRLRSRILDIAVLLAASSGALTCCAALIMFLGALQNVAWGAVLFTAFGAALACAIGALTAFSVETILSGRTVRDSVDDADDALQRRQGGG
jgi:hypothetical protein